MGSRSGAYCLERGWFLPEELKVEDDALSANTAETVDAMGYDAITSC